MAPFCSVCVFVYFLNLYAYAHSQVALLAERHVTDYTWFVDVTLKLIRLAGDYVPDEVGLTL